GGATFTRPSDGGPSGRSNYLANMGRQPIPRTTDGKIGGLFYVVTINTQWTTYKNHPPAVRANEVTDGTSNTAMFAEIKRGLCGGDTAGNDCPPGSPPYVAQDLFLT